MTITPRPRDRIPGRTARRQWWTPLTLTSIAPDQAPGSVVAKGPIGSITAALAIIASTPPKAASAWATAAATAA